MKICYLDAFSGISGDMTIGALIDAGVDAAALTAALDSLGTGATFKIEKVKRHGIAATKFDVVAPETRGHRHLSHIVRMIDAAEALPEKVKADAKAVFRNLGEAEAKVHNIPIEKVHFHEVGAVDSICDIVGACFGLHYLGIEAVYSSPLNLGSGTVQCDHGLMPVPAPATAELVAGKPVYALGPAVELTTPTGAAIITTYARDFGAMPAMHIAATGYGAGTKDFPNQANVLRLLIGETTGAAETTTVSVLEANIDDSTPQMLGFAMERLFEQGALDVTMEALLMKKNRPGTLLRVIADPADQERLARTMLDETSTLGLRIYKAERRVQARKTVEVETPHGKVRIKVAESGSFTPEYDDCRNLALAAGVPLKTVLAEANLAYLNISK